MIPHIEVLKLYKSNYVSNTEFNLVYKMAKNVHEMAKLHGILSLNNVIFEYDHPKLFKEGLQYIIDGIDSNELNNKISESILKLDNNKEITLSIMYLQCMLSLQNGDNEYILKMRLASFRGIDSINRVIKNIS